MSVTPTHGTYHARRVSFREYRRAYPFYPALAQYLITRFEPGLTIALNTPATPIHPDELNPDEQTWLERCTENAHHEGLTPHTPTLTLTTTADEEQRAITFGASSASAALYRIYTSDTHEAAAAYTLSADGHVMIAQNAGAVFTSNLPHITHAGTQRPVTYIGGQGQPSRLVYALTEQHAATDTQLSPQDWDTLRAAHLRDMDAHLIHRRIITLE